LLGVTNARDRPRQQGGNCGQSKPRRMLHWRPLLRTMMGTMNRTGTQNRYGTIPPTRQAPVPDGRGRHPDRRAARRTGQKQAPRPTQL
jgi:hypothetical protein